jgi:CO/xanthine dehydrogenase Mo-binding subunit
MTGFMHEREFSRKSFIKGGGALIVGFSMLGGGAVAKGAAEDPFSSNGPYDLGQIDSWIAIHGDNTATIKLGKVELGQGSSTGLLMIAGEELDMDLSRLKHIHHDTNVTPNQGTTAGSQSIQTGGKQLRAAAAAAKSTLLGLASKQLGVPVASLSVESGIVSGGGKTVTYGQLLGDKLFNVKMPSSYQVSGTGGFRGPTGLAAGAPLTKPVGQYKLVGTSPARIDIPDKISGTYTYVHNIKVPGMLHGRIVRPRGQGAYGGGTAPAVLSIDESSIKHIPDVRVVRAGNFVGVVAPREYDAIQAAAQLKVKWAPLPAIREVGNLFKGMRDDDSAGKAPARIVVDYGKFDSAFAGAAHKLEQSYKYHYNGHLPIGPSCCVADVTPGGARIFSNTQDAYGTRQNVKDALDLVMGAKTLPLDRIRVTYYEGSSVYGSAPYRDAAQAASVMSALVGKPVRVQFMRWDEHGWDNYGPAQMTDIRAAADAKGNIVAFEFTALGIPYWTTPATEQQVGGKPVFSALSHVDATISGEQYNLTNRRVIGKSLPLENTYFKVTYLRSPDAPQSGFAAELAVDELAYMANMDPVQFRLQNIAGPASKVPDVAQRWKNVLVNAAKDAGWQPKVAASKLSSADLVTGRGIAFGHYANSMTCCIADIEVNKKTGKIVVKNLHVAADSGLVVYPAGAENNEEGAAVQGASRALVEEVAFNGKQVTSLDWVTYPMMRFKDAPKVYVHELSRADVPDPSGPGSRSTGSGEPALPPVAPAIANAFFDATGVRIREAPMTPARVRGVLAAAR